MVDDRPHRAQNLLFWAMVMKLDELVLKEGMLTRNPYFFFKHLVIRSWDRFQDTFLINSGKLSHLYRGRHDRATGVFSPEVDEASQVTAPVLLASLFRRCLFSRKMLWLEIFFFI